MKNLEKVTDSIESFIQENKMGVVCAFYSDEDIYIIRNHDHLTAEGMKEAMVSLFRLKRTVDDLLDRLAQTGEYNPN